METQSDSELISANILRLIRLPDLISICNALLGFLAILILLTGGGGLGALKDALVVILSAAVIDGLDGLVSRRIERSLMGRYLDSLADMVSFGVAPPVAAFVFMSTYAHPVTAVCSAYMVCGMLRLARFDARGARATVAFTVEGGSDRVEDEDENFEGFPITGSAVFLASFMLLALQLCIVPPSSLSILLCVLMAILCILMTSRIRYENLRDIRIAIPLGCIFSSLILFYSLHSPLFIYPTAIITALTALYISSPAFYHPKSFNLTR